MCISASPCLCELRCVLTRAQVVDTVEAVAGATGTRFRTTLVWLFPLKIATERREKKRDGGFFYRRSR